MVDSQPKAAPYLVEGVVGITRTLEKVCPSGASREGEPDRSLLVFRHHLMPLR